MDSRHNLLEEWASNPAFIQRLECEFERKAPTEVISFAWEHTRPRDAKRSYSFASLEIAIASVADIGRVGRLHRRSICCRVVGRL